ncbi:MAG: hypothetical protein ACYCY1_15495 [Sulfuriferula sp.]
MIKLMTNQNPLTMKRIFCSLLSGAALFAVAGSASAVGVGAGLDANVGAGARGNAGMEAPTAAGAHAEGSAGMNQQGSSHMSTEGSANQNSQMSPESTKGMDRAHERMNGMGSEHQAPGAGTKTKQSVKSHHKVKSKAKSEAQ